MWDLFSLTSALSRRLDALLGSVLVQDLSDFELNLTILASAMIAVDDLADACFEDLRWKAQGNCSRGY